MRRLFHKNKELILEEVLEVKGLMQLLMKHRNTGRKWTGDELKEIKFHLRQISKAVPVLIVFMLPFGSFFLPLLAEVIDRRKDRRP